MVRYTARQALAERTRAVTLLTPNEVAIRLGLHYHTVLQMIKRGDLFAVNLGRSYRVPAVAFECFIRGLPYDPRDVSEDFRLLRQDAESAELARREAEAQAARFTPQPTEWESETFNQAGQHQTGQHQTRAEPPRPQLKPFQQKPAAAPQSSGFDWEEYAPSNPSHPHDDLAEQFGITARDPDEWE